MCKFTHWRCSAPPMGPLHFTLSAPLISSMMPKQWEHCGVPFIQSTSISQKLLYRLPRNLQYASCTHTHTDAHRRALTHLHYPVHSSTSLPHVCGESGRRRSGATFESGFSSSPFYCAQRGLCLCLVRRSSTATDDPFKRQHLLLPIQGSQWEIGAEENSWGCFGISTILFRLLLFVQPDLFLSIYVKSLHFAPPIFTCILGGIWKLPTCVVFNDT